MDKKKKTAILLGATGLVGDTLLKLLLKDERYSKVVVFSRKALDLKHQKLEIFIGDLLDMERFSNHFYGDEVYCCIGSTKAKTPDLNVYKKIDYGIPVSAAQLCKSNDIKTMIIISALGADSKSSLFYNRIKGEMENAVLALNLDKTHMVQPALIGGNRREKRPGESLFKALLGALNMVMIGPFKKYRIIMPETIAKAMLWLANHPYDLKRIPSETLKELAQHGTS